MNKKLELINKRKKEGVKYLFEYYYASLCHFSSIILKDINLSEELVLDTFKKLWKDKVYFYSANSLTSYLYNNVQSSILIMLKKNSSRQDSSKEVKNYDLIFLDDEISKLIIEEEVYREVFMSLINVSLE